MYKMGNLLRTEYDSEDDYMDDIVIEKIGLHSTIQNYGEVILNLDHKMNKIDVSDDKTFNGD